MTAVILEEAGADLAGAFEHYRAIRLDLGVGLLDEFRRGVDRILTHPNAWQPLDKTYRCCRLHRFPYRIIYRSNQRTKQVVIVAIMHLSRKPDIWRERY